MKRMWEAPHPGHQPFFDFSVDPKSQQQIIINDGINLEEERKRKKNLGETIQTSTIVYKHVSGTTRIVHGTEVSAAACDVVFLVTTVVDGHGRWDGDRCRHDRRMDVLHQQTVCASVLDS
jgi:hypothetical protein